MPSEAEGTFFMETAWKAQKGNKWLSGQLTGRRKSETEARPGVK